MTEIEKLLEQKKQLENKIKTVKAKEAAKKRKIDTRKKVLLGATMMTAVHNKDVEWHHLKALLNKYLIKDKDRVLFDLPTLPKDQ